MQKEALNKYKADCKYQPPVFRFGKTGGCFMFTSDFCKRKGIACAIPCSDIWQAYISPASLRDFSLVVTIGVWIVRTPPPQISYLYCIYIIPRLKNLSIRFCRQGMQGGDGTRWHFKP